MSIGLGQLLIILIIVFILFGAGKIPQVMGDLGKGLKAFKENLNEPNTNIEAPKPPSNSSSNSDLK